MALTRITKGVIKPNENYDTHNINSTGIITAVGANFSGNVSVGGTLTYQDVTNIDSAGIITARTGIKVLAGGINVVGVSTFTGTDALKLTGSGQVNLLVGSTNAGGASLRLDGDANGDGSGGDYAYMRHKTSGAFEIVNLKNQSIDFLTNGTNRWYIYDGGTFAPHVDSTYDIGTNSTRVRNIYADTLYGDGSNLTGLPSGVTINNNANNRIITGSGTANTLNANSNLTFSSGSGILSLTGDIHVSGEVAIAENIIHTGDGNTKFGFPANDTITFTTNGGERLRINSSGNMGLGTDQINFPSGGGMVIYHSTAPRLKLVNSSTGTGSGDGAELSIDAATKDFYIENRDGEDIIFYAGAELGRFNADNYFIAKGVAGQYSDNTTGTLYHQFNQTGSGRRICVMRQEHHAGLGLEVRMNSTGNGEALWVSYQGSSVRFRVLASGNVANTNNSYGSLSDVSLKENIVDANSQWDDIKAVKVRNFNLKDDTDKVKMLGVVAQELETVSPNLVWEDKEGLKGVSYSVLYMKAMKCLQEAQARIETLEAKVSALEGS